MSNFTAGIDWYNPANRQKASLIGEDIMFELEELKRVAIAPELAAVYQSHKKRLSILNAKLTRLYNKDTNEWLQGRISKATTDYSQ